MPLGPQPILPVHLPDDVRRLLGSTLAAAAQVVEEMVLIDLRRRGLISGGFVAKTLGISKWDFMDLLAKYELPSLDLTEDELRAGRKAIWDHRKAAGRQPAPDR